MVGMNSQIHLAIDTAFLRRLKEEAKDKKLSVSELIRRKLANPPTEEEIMQLRKIKRIFLK